MVHDNYAGYNASQFNPANLADSRFSSYFDTKPTTTNGAVVVETKDSLAKSELLKTSDKVIEILQFSGLFCDEMTMTFSSEIRLAKLYDNTTGKTSYVKGGSLSGSLDNFNDVKWSDANRLFNRTEWGDACFSYYGPDCALLNDVTISS